MRRTTFFAATLVVAAVLLIGATTVQARQETPPRSFSAKVMVPDEVMTLELKQIFPEMLLAEDQAKASEAGPLRYALPFDVQISPNNHGTWEIVDGGSIWRLRVVSPGATDLNFGFGTYRLPEGATLHVSSLDYGYFQGPFTAADNREHGQLWTPVIPGERAMIELFVPDKAAFKPELELIRVGAGYRDLFKLTKRTSMAKQGYCNIDVICPLGDGWRDQIRAVAVYGTGGSNFCTGTLVNNLRQDFRPFFLTANHCQITSSNAASVVAYWNFESSTCGALSGGTLNQSTSGATYRASDYANDFTLIEFQSQPSAAYNVYYTGWDARSSTAPQSSICIHHPNCDEKAISYNDDALTTMNSCIGTGGTNTHWRVDSWEQGTTEPGSSGSALFDPATHRQIGYLSGGQAACGNSDYDCFGKFSVGWSRGLSTWLDPDSTGTQYMNGSNPGGGGNISPTASFSYNVNNLSVTFTDTSSDPDGTVVGWSWTFGDGASSSSQNPSHTYSSAGTYTVSLTVTDNDGGTGSTSAQVSVSTTGVIALTNGVPVSNLSAAKGVWKHYKIDVPSGASNLVMKITGGSGDADLYTRFGSQPTSSTYDCRPYRNGNEETCTVASPQVGTYYLSIYAYAAYSGLTIQASFSTGGGDDELQNGVPVTGLSASQGDWVRYTIQVPSGASNLVIQISGGSGDADLYTRYSVEPTTSSYDCRPYLYGNNETCTEASPSAGTWHIGIRAYSSFASVTLVASYD